MIIETSRPRAQGVTTLMSVSGADGLGADPAPAFPVCCLRPASHGLMAAGAVGILGMSGKTARRVGVVTAVLSKIMGW